MESLGQCKVQRNKDDYLGRLKKGLIKGGKRCRIKDDPHAKFRKV